jgi:hypothetical protein
VKRAYLAAALSLALAGGLMLALVMARRERPVTATWRHLDLTICHAPWCRWTPQHPEDCDCPDWRSA